MHTLNLFYLQPVFFSGVNWQKKVGHHHTTTPYRSFVSETTPLTSTCLFFFFSGQPPFPLNNASHPLGLVFSFCKPKQLLFTVPLPLFERSFATLPPPLHTGRYLDKLFCVVSFLLFTVFSCLVFFFYLTSMLQILQQTSSSPSLSVLLMYHLIFCYLSLSLWQVSCFSLFDFYYIYVL